MTSYLPIVSQLSHLSHSEKTRILNELFEPCPDLTQYLIPLIFADSREYDSYGTLIEEIRRQLMVLAHRYQDVPTPELKETIEAIVGAHPRLGTPKKTGLSSHSRNEQKTLNGGDPGLAKRLTNLNEEYEEAFPGLRYVVFVNGRSRPIIMEDMKRRIERNDCGAEILDSFNAMCDIALDRAAKFGAKL
ncbi:DEKNAAC104860 [Brettanomyces naardenensis]|uniref:DEKNAAC104860 n=1 Tax=Brettanomyces naardenensis TaxID=13370 RepID=A0A448YSG6_BRENA|nr:DEKNAAC104860 [Brettanomyces naardenensis]